MRFSFQPPFFDALFSALFFVEKKSAAHDRKTSVLFPSPLFFHWRKKNVCQILKHGHVGEALQATNQVQNGENYFGRIKVCNTNGKRIPVLRIYPKNIARNTCAVHIDEPVFPVDLPSLPPSGKSSHRPSLSVSPHNNVIVPRAGEEQRRTRGAPCNCYDHCWQ